jgi:hypothetical protein
LLLPALSGSEITSAIPKLSHRARREFMRRIIAAGQEAAILRERHQPALARFQMPGQMESEHETNAAR